jgi:hypothetical protein
MNITCNKEWTRQFMTTAFTRVFLNNDYKKHKEQLLFEQEQALLPATQPIVENILKCEKINEQISTHEQELAAIYARMAALRGEKNRLERGINSRTPLEERATFIKACPDQSCRGFLSSQWKCGICEQWTCPDCHEIKGTTRDSVHECNPDNVETAKLLANDTKSCPSCGTGIHKLEGCDQMFCTMCHTGFSWKTGRIETNIHNPHYYEWLASIPNNNEAGPQPLDCEEFPTAERFHRFLLEHDHVVSYNPQVYLSLHRMVTHLREVVFPRVRQDRVPSNQDLRIQFLVGDIDEERWARLLQYREQRRMKLNALYLLTDLAIQLFSDVIARLIRDPNNPYALPYIAKMITYLQQSLDRVCRLYGGTIPEGWKSVMENIPWELRMRG